MKKVVWCISKYALPAIYGTQYRLFYISEMLNKLGFESYVFTSATNHLAPALPKQKKKFRIEEIEGSKTIFIKGPFFKTSLAKVRVFSWFVFEYYLFQFISGEYKNYVKKPDVVIVSSLSLLTILNGYYAKKKFGCKLIFEIRDIWPLTAIHVMGHSKWNPFIWFLRRVEKFGYRKSDVVTSTLPNAIEHIQESVSKKVKFEHIPQGFNPDDYSNSESLDDEFISKYIPKNKFIVAYIGNIVAAYDLDTLVECARILDDGKNNIHFLILGDGNYKETLQKKSEGLTNITFIPKLPRTKLQAFLKHCNVASNFLRPVPFFKFGVSPQKLIDYLMAEKPVIMSYTGYKTIIDEVNCGSVVEAGNVDKLTKVFIEYSKKSDEELDAIGKRGKKYLLNNLSWQKIVEKYTNLF